MLYFMLDGLAWFIILCFVITSTCYMIGKAEREYKKRIAEESKKRKSVFRNSMFR